MDNNNNGSDSCYLKSLNKASLKITKPTRKPFSLPDSIPIPNPIPNPNPLLSTQQPPVYNINKNDFREVVQKLTGSPATQPNNTTPASTSRLQRIRPPPLIQINKLNENVSSFLPPLPSVHHASESPISAYMRVLQNSTGMGPINGNDVADEKESPISNYMRVLQNSVYSEQGNSNSPLPFGCVPSSSMSQYQNGMLGSPILLFSPTSGMPLSPALSLPSPRWNGV